MTLSNRLSLLSSHALGRVLFCLMLAPPLTPLLAQEQGVAINFRDAEISSLIESVAEITGRSFVLDPRVSGRITIIAPERIDADLLYQAFLSAIQVQGFQAVDDGAVTRIVPMNQAFGVLAGGDNMLETRLIKVENVDAASLIPVVKPLLSNAARLQAFSQTNYLVVTDTRANVAELVKIVAEMDDPSQSALEVIDLEYISAGEAVHIISQLQSVRERGLSVVEDTLNNRLIISGPSSARTAFRRMLLSLDVPTNRSGGVEVMYLDFARAEKLKPVIEGMLSSNMFLLVAGENREQGNYRVEVDESNNALIIAASPAVIQEVRKVVQQLDISRPQVLIEAVIAELSQDQAQRISAQLAYLDQNNGGYLTRFDNILTTLLGAGADGNLDSGDIQAIGSSLGNVSGGLAVGGSFDARRGTGFALLIQALKSDGRTRVLSTPSVVTLDNEEANLSVGEEVPFITGSFTTPVNQASSPFQTINREEVGIKLRVQPQISKGDAIRLSLEQESSKLLNNASQRGTADVVTSKSTISTNVLVQNGELLVLGGLIDGQFDEVRTKVPLLGDIPLLGALFRSSARSNGERVLMMFIRPTILRDPGTALSVSEQRFRHLINRDMEESEFGEMGTRMESFLNQDMFVPVIPRAETGEVSP